MTDPEEDIYSMLNALWNPAFADKPVIYRPSTQDTIGKHDGRIMTIKLYQYSAPEQTVRGLGAPTKSVEYGVSIDLRGPSRTKVLEARDEILRILDIRRTNPTSDYAKLRHDGGKKVAGYAGFYHYVVDCRLSKRHEVI